MELVLPTRCGRPLQCHVSAGNRSHLKLGRNGRDDKIVFSSEVGIHGIQFARVELAVIDEHFANDAAEILLRNRRVAVRIAVAPADNRLPRDGREIRHIGERWRFLAETKIVRAQHAIDPVVKLIGLDTKHAGLNVIIGR